ncbi:MAG: LysM peptidoglycan-binding domain-containing protein [Elusimicrobia bacterium]|nr:LysM peptidoglycan-binding domain-containing protein [Elusimicrobiota bacterium]
MKLVILLAGLALICPAFSEDAESPAKPGFKVNKKHVVMEGETLWGMSARYYSDPFKWGKIYNANLNSIKNPDLIHPGDEIEVPDIIEEVKPVIEVKKETEPEKKDEPITEEAQPIAEVVGIASDTYGRGTEPPALDEPEARCSGRSAAVPPAAEIPVPEAPAAEISESLEETQPEELSEDMPRDQKEWSSMLATKVAERNWSADGQVIGKEKEESALGLSFSGEVVVLKIRSSVKASKGDLFAAYKTGSRVYDKNGKFSGIEIQKTGILKIVLVEKGTVYAEIIDANTSILKGQVVKRMR